MLTQSELQKQLHYCPDTGLFTRIITNSPRVKIGDIAGYLETHGYIRLNVHGKLYRAQRLAWLYTYGEFPYADVDHINGVRNDNRIINLREATRAENLQNKKHPQSNNKSGFLGVSWHKETKKWKAAIQINGKSIHLGLFSNPEIAYEAYIKAKREMHRFCTI